jgi:hypothetical protein
MDIRKIVYWQEEVCAEAGRALPTPVHRVAVAAVIANPYAGQFVEDLSPLFDVGQELGGQLMPRLVELLARPPVSYGKGAIVGTLGEAEHGAAILHPKLGKPVREAVGGGAVIIPANVKVAAPGAELDVPLAHKDEIWSFDELDTLTISVPGAPRPDEIVVVIALADRGRPLARVGKSRAIV